MPDPSAAPHSSPCARERRATRMIPFIVGCALFMQMLDATVVATALPAMAQSLGVSAVQMNVAITSYLLAAAVFVPVSGWAADRFGARNVFMAAITLFTVSSLACAVSHTLTQLVVSRVVQGLAGAMMVPVGRIIMLRQVPKEDLLRAMAFLSMPALLGPIIGPPLGGFLVTYASWHWIFLINIPMGALGLLMVRNYIVGHGSTSRRRLDWLGFILSAGAMACLVSGFEALGHGGLAAWKVVGLISFGALCAVLYVWHAKRAQSPIIDLSLLKIPTFAIATLGGNLCRFTVGAGPFLLAILLQVAFGMSPFAAGLITFTGAVGSILMKFVATPIIRRFGFRQVLIVNAVLTGGLMALCGVFRPDTPWWVMVAILIAGGFTRSLQFTAVNTLTYADMQSADMSRASSFAATAQQLGVSLGVACSALAINVSMAVRGAQQPAVVDVVWAFVLIGLLTVMSILSFRKLHASAGSALHHKAAKTN